MRKDPLSFEATSAVQRGLTDVADCLSKLSPPAAKTIGADSRFMVSRIDDARMLLLAFSDYRSKVVCSGRDKPFPRGQQFDHLAHLEIQDLVSFIHWCIDRDEPPSKWALSRWKKETQ